MKNAKLDLYSTVPFLFDRHEKGGKQIEHKEKRELDREREGGFLNKIRFREVISFDFLDKH